MIRAAGTNQTACQSVLTFTETRDAAAGGDGCRSTSPVSPSLQCFISIFGIKQSWLRCSFSPHCKVYVWSGKSSTVTAFSFDFLSGICSVQLQWLLLCMLTSKLLLCWFKQSIISTTLEEKAEQQTKYLYEVAALFSKHKFLIFLPSASFKMLIFFYWH